MRTFLAIGIGIGIALPAFGGVREQALEIAAQAHQIENAAAPDDTVSFYASSAGSGLLVRHVWVRIDGGVLLHHQYSDDEGRALLAGGVHHLGTARLADGEHRLRIEFIGRDAVDRAGGDRTQDHVEVPFVKTAGRARVGVEIGAPGTFSGNSEIRLAAWTGTNPVSGDELPAREATFLAGSGRMFDAQVFAPGIAPPAPAGDALTALYNEAIAPIASGGTAADPSALAAFIHSPACEDPRQVLCDHARVVLGYHHLRRREGDLAADAFRAVQSPGPYASRAVLGLGWAMLAPPGGGDGAALTAAPYDVGNAARLRSRMPLPTGDARREALLAALTPWSTLIGGDPLEPPVQEAALAIAWAFDLLGARQQAQQRRLSVATGLEDMLAILAQAKNDARAGRLADLVDAGSAESELGWERTLAPATDPGAARWVRALLTDDAFSAAVAAQRDAHDVVVALDRHDARLQPIADPRAQECRDRIAALRPLAMAEEASTRSQLAAAADAPLEALRRQTEGYLVEARFALARTYDQPAEVVLK